MPGFDYKFLEKPKRRFQCPLCSKAMRDPVQVSTCGHRFCDTCLQEFLRHLQLTTVRGSSSAQRTSCPWTMPRSTLTQSWSSRSWLCPSAASTVRKAVAGPDR
uniref:Tnf receptor-associated factor 4a n=1 Tax=Oncorhynchus tshawytscha TaxID=74940 RepID=A0AAZ3PRQ6_ONCTS